MLSDEWPEGGHLSPELLRRHPDQPACLCGRRGRRLHARDRCGREEERAVQDQFYGDRSGTFLDPFGHRWNFATHVEDVSEDELQRRMEQFSASQEQKAPA